MKKRTFKEKISYWFDRMISKGPMAMSLLLFAVTSAIIGAIGTIAYFISDDGGILYQLWSSLMYTLDAGNLASVPTDNIIYLMLMFLSTLCGLFLTSVLIGIITTGVEDKLSNLRKGSSVVQEDEHTLIIGFDNNIYDILHELIEANSNKKNACIVILGEQEKGEMEDAIAAHITDCKTTRIICRSGKLHEAFAFARCSVETSHSVIINVQDDAETIKILLALATYVKNKKLRNKDLQFITSLQDNQYVEAANIAGEGRASIIFAQDAIARIISNTCRQHGLSQVLTELFNFGGDELYFESVPMLEGKTFKEATLSFSNAVVIGLYSNNIAKLNPPMNTMIEKNDQIILLELDDGAYRYHPAKTADESKICNSEGVSVNTRNNLIILGSNEKLPTIVAEYAKYMKQNTRIIVVDDDFDITTLDAYENIEITVFTEKITRKLLLELLTENANNILLLNDNSRDPESSDSQTLLRLITLRDIANKTALHFSITTEMRSADNQRLASQARVDDFVIGSNFTSLMLAQISENPKMLPLINDLLDEDGSELYMKPVSNYVITGVPVDFYTLTESAARKGEIFIGYKLGNKDIIVNPPKDEFVIFGESDQIVVIAER